MIRRLEVEADEISSFVRTKAHKQWIWIAMDATTRQVIVFHVGDRSHTSAKRLWAKMSEAYRQHATCYPDQYVVYERVIPTDKYAGGSWPPRDVYSSAAVTIATIR